jgi:hypothetical protein
MQTRLRHNQEGYGLVVQEVSFLTMHDIISHAIDELLGQETDEEVLQS